MLENLKPCTRVGKYAVLGFIIAELVLSFVIQYTSGHVCAAFSYAAVCLAALMGVLTVTPVLGRAGSLPVLVGLGFTVLAASTARCLASARERATCRWRRWSSSMRL